MPEPRAPKYRWGQRVAAAVDLHNDGSFPDEPPAARLAAQGEVGEIVRIGRHVDADLAVYLVEFGARVIGCLEDEITPHPPRGKP